MKKSGFSNDVTPKDERISARGRQNSSAGRSRDAATPDARQVHDQETTIQSSISRIDAKLERS